MKYRRLRLVLLSLTLIVLLACIALMAINPFWLFTVGHTTPTSYRSLSLEAGSVQYGWASVASDPVDQGWWGFSHGPVGPGDPQFTPFVWRPRQIDKPRNYLLMVPLWMIGLPALGAAMWLSRGVRRRSGHCACGYDRAGLAPSAKCPECGRLGVYIN